MSFVHKSVAYQQSHGYDRLFHNNIFRSSPPDFDALASKYESTFGKVVRRNEGPSSSGARSGSCWMDWTDAAAVRCYTTTILREYFELENVSLASDMLCPAVPNRLNYLCWVNELLGSVIELHRCQEGSPPTPTSVLGLDIGVGGSCIYPLLGCKFNTQLDKLEASGAAPASGPLRRYVWRFVGSDVSARAVELAQANALRNGFLDRITVVQVPPSLDLQQLALRHLTAAVATTAAAGARATSCEFDCCSENVCRFVLAVRAAMGSGSLRGPVRTCVAARAEWVVLLAERERLFAAGASGNSLTVTTSEPACEFPVHFCMCNPPFYSLEEEEAVLAAPNPSTVCTGGKGEMFTLGGEIAFVLAMVVDSLVLRCTVQWYTVMVGRKSSLAVILKFIHKLHRLWPASAPCWVHTVSFVHGSTTRWGLAWTFASELDERGRVLLEGQLGPGRLRRVTDIYCAAVPSSETADPVHPEGEATLEMSAAEFMQSTLPAEVEEGTEAAAASGLPERALKRLAAALTGLTCVKYATGAGADSGPAVHVPLRLNCELGDASSSDVAQLSVSGQCFVRLPVRVRSRHAGDSDTLTALLGGNALVLQLGTGVSAPGGVEDEAPRKRPRCSSHCIAVAGGATAADESTVAVLMGFRVRISLVGPALPSAASEVGSSELTQTLRLVVVQQEQEQEQEQRRPGEAPALPGHQRRQAFCFLLDKAKADFLRNNRRWRKLLAVGMRDCVADSDN